MHPAQLARLRAAHSAVLVESCTIWRKVKATNAAGGAADSWEMVGQVACRLMPESNLRRTQALAAERETLISYYRLTVPHDADLRPDDRVVYAGNTYEIIALWGDHAQRTARRAVVAKVS